MRFCGAYHGWWGDVQPGVGNPLPPHETYTLEDMAERTLRVLRTRRDIACVLVNPLQALHPNAGAPGDSALVDSARSARLRPRRLHRVAEGSCAQVCTERGIVLIFDEVFVGFRLARRRRAGVFRRARRHGDLRQDASAAACRSACVCGRSDLMRRFRDDRPADICFARGTFNSHPYVMGGDGRVPAAGSQDPDVRALYRRPRRDLERRARGS